MGNRRESSATIHGHGGQLVSPWEPRGVGEWLHSCLYGIAAGESTSPDDSTKLAAAEIITLSIFSSQDVMKNRERYLIWVRQGGPVIFSWISRISRFVYDLLSPGIDWSIIKLIHKRRVAILPFSTRRTAKQLFDRQNPGTRCCI